MKKFVPLILFLITSTVAIAQKGVIKGNVIDAETGEELIGVTIRVGETGSLGTTTDFNGNYKISVEPGSYDIIVSYISYATQRVEGVSIEVGAVKQLDFAMQTEDVQLEEIVVQAEQINNNEVALLKLQQKSYAVQDGISSAEIKRIGATNSAESMKQVTGASVEGGKYVVMRGLGDRYSLTQVNGVTLPSTDPYRNSADIDLIPTTVVENIVTTKTFLPDKPGNFTGGAIDITTKSLPDEFYLNAGVSVAYNTQSSFLDNSFFTDPIEGSNDWLGYDDGSRDFPNETGTDEVLELLGDRGIFTDVRSNSEEFNEERRIFDEASKSLAARSYLPQTKSTSLNQRYTLAVGDRFAIGDKNLGYNFSLNFSRAFTNFPDRTLNIYELPGDQTSDLIENFITDGQQSEETATIGLLASVAYQFNNKNEIQANYTYSNDGLRQVSSFSGIWPGAISNPHTFTSRAIRYQQRELSNIQLTGNHVLPGLNEAKFTWVGSIVNSLQYEPDFRLFANQVNTGGEFEINQAEYDRPFQFWRDLQDEQVNFKADLEIPVGEKSLGNIFKFGGLFTRKDRDFGEFRYQEQDTRTREEDFLTFNEANGDFAAYFDPSNAGIVGFDDTRNINRIGSYYLNESVPSNFYVGEEQVIAGYVMGVYNLNDWLKAIAGVRVEKTDFRTEARNDSVGVIDELDFLPSVNLVFKLNEKSNLRASASQTLARPNMREMAPFASFPLTGGFIRNGNLNLGRTLVQNYDLRYELFPNAGELIAASVFYKSFTDPIVQRLSPVGSGGQITPVNVSDATLYGIELEFRKSLDFIAPVLEDLKFSTNFTYTYSEVPLTDEEFEAFQRVNPNIGRTRPFQAQSPFIFNANLTYINDKLGLESTVYVNMFGERLFANGFGGSPDVFEVYGDGDGLPTPDITLNIRKSLFENFTVGFRIENLLDYTISRKIDFRDDVFYTEQYKIGTTYNLSLRYKLGFY